MSKTIGNVLYDTSEMLYLGAEYPEAEIPTDILYFSYGNNDDDDEQPDSSDSSEIAPEHLAAANYIRDMLDKGVLVKDEDTAAQRPCRPSDFCILVRTNKVQSKLAKALETVGLDSFYETSDGYMRAREILVMINLLRVIDSPLNDLAMLSVMLSPVFGFTAEEVTEIRLLCNIDKAGIRKKLYQIINAVSKDSDDTHEREAERIEVSSELLRQKCRYAVELVKKLRYYAASLPLEALISKIYSEYPRRNTPLGVASANA